MYLRDFTWERFLLLLYIISFTGCRTDNQAHKSWEIYKGDAESTSYSSLVQINTENVNQLEIAWTFRPDDSSAGSWFGKYECNPIIVDGVMYATSASHWLYAINAGNGQAIWWYDPFDGHGGGGISRGVSYWEDDSDQRILFTAGNYLYAIDASTGEPITSFGEQGKVNLNFTQDQNDEAWVIPTSPGIVYRDLLILGSEVSELYGAAPGHIRAFNIRTGALSWTFHTIPQPGEPGYETWPDGAWEYTGGANNWGGMSLDAKRGMVFVPLGSPTYDFYGANRKGKNLYGNCLVALNAENGNLIWYFQTVHHDLWDYDLPAPPNLITIKANGKVIDAVALTTKTGFLFVFNRETGESLFPIDERPVPASDIPGEEVWPTQPFPQKPAPYARQHLTQKDLAWHSNNSFDSLQKRFRELRFEGLFTPPAFNGTLMVPGSRGGSEWGGAAFDPATGILYLNANESPEISTVQPIRFDHGIENQTTYDLGKAIYENYCASCHGIDRKGLAPNHPSLVNLESRMTQQEASRIIKSGGGRMPGFAKLLKGKEEEIIAYLYNIQNQEKSTVRDNFKDTTARFLNTTAYSFFKDGEGRPGIKPPWGTLNAINLNTGEYVWKHPLGNHPELQEPGAPVTGSENYGGPIVTAGGLIFIGATTDNKFRAFDKETGVLLWETTLPGNGFATPATYMLNGKQYLAISVTGSREEPSGCIIAFALSD